MLVTRTTLLKTYPMNNVLLHLPRSIKVGRFWNVGTSNFIWVVKERMLTECRRISGKLNSFYIMIVKNLGGTY